MALTLVELQAVSVLTRKIMNLLSTLRERLAATNNELQAVDQRASAVEVLVLDIGRATDAVSDLATPSRRMQMPLMLPWCT